jgi:hypothetical protein
VETQTNAVAEVATAAGVDCCPNCGGAQGVFCQQCGQKKTDPADLTVRRFLKSTLHELTDLDSKFLRTFAALLFHPGRLTEEYLAGRKERYLSPLKLYLIISAVYFFFAWKATLRIGDFAQRLRESPLFSGLARREGPEQAILFEQFLEKSGEYSAFPRFASVLILGLMLLILFYRVKKFYVEHLIFSFHYYSFDFCFFTLLTLPLMAYGALTGRDAPAWIFNAGAVVLFVYLFAALRRVYWQSALKTFFKAVVLLVGDLVLTSIATLAAIGAAYVAVYLV